MRDPGLPKHWLGTREVRILSGSSRAHRGQDAILKASRGMSAIQRSTHDHLMQLRAMPGATLLLQLRAHPMLLG